MGIRTRKERNHVQSAMTGDVIADPDMACRFAELALRFCHPHTESRVKHWSSAIEATPG